MTLQSELLKSLRVYQNHVAIKESGTQISYNQLLSSSNKMAKFLLAKNQEPGAIIGIALNTISNTISAMIGVLLARCAFVIIDNRLPDKRLSEMISDLKPGCLITDKLVNQGAVAAVKQYLFEEIQASQETVVTYPDFDEDDSVYIYFTSGSTGKPKGIIGRNVSLTQFLNWEIKAFDIVSGMQFSQFISPYFDAFLRDVFVPLLSGGTVCVPPKEDDFFSFKKLSEWLELEKVNVVHCVPSVFRILNHSRLNTGQLPELKYVLMSGEKIIPSDLRTWYEIFGNRVQLVNLYGTTETTMIRCMYRINPLDAEKSRMPIGDPIDDTEILIADNHMNPCGPLIAGDLYIVTPYATKGYLKDPQLTAEKFIVMEEEPIRKIGFRTGDKARRLFDGTIELLGREDRQIKLRGIRIELEEIELALARAPEIRNAVVTVDSKSETLSAYVILNQEAKDNNTWEASVMSYASENLPDYMLPARYIDIAEYPLLTTGKINYGALGEYKKEKTLVGAANEMEAKILNIWKSILGEKEISADESFHKAGGSSLGIMRLISKMFSEFNIRVSLSELFSNITVQQQAILISGKIVAFHLSNVTAPSTSTSIQKTKKKEYYRVSSGQQRLYFLYEFDQSSLAYNLPVVVALTGLLDKEKLSGVFRKLIERHESLRTSFHVTNGTVFQQVQEEGPFELEWFEAPDSGVESLIRDFIRPFDLRHAPLIRVGLIRLSAESHLLLVDMHHIITDGVSQGILIKDFMSLYNGEELPALALQYKDYAEWQHEERQQERIAAQHDFWKKEFAESVSVLSLPTDFARPPVKDYAGGSRNFSFDRETTSKLKSLGDEVGATLFMTMLSLFNVLLSKLSNQEDISVGTPVAGRDHADLEGIMGVFINTLVLRNYPKGGLGFKEFLSEVKSKSLMGFEHQSYQYDELIGELNLSRDTSHNPLFDVMFVLQNVERTELVIPGLKLERQKSGHSVSKFDLILIAQESDHGLVMDLEYSTALFKQESVDRMISCLRRIVEEVLRNPEIKLSQIDILSPAEREQLVHSFNLTHVNYQFEKTVIDLFEEQAMLVPDQVALHFKKNTMTYSELQKSSSRVANYLREEFGVGRGDLVGVLLDREEELLPMIYGIMKAGGVYVPLSINYPAARIDSILSDSGMKVLVSRTVYKNLFSAERSSCKFVNLDQVMDRIKDFPDAALAERPAGRDLAYLIYTSGSTGSPKGVEIEHRSLWNYVYWASGYYLRGEKASFPLFTSISFDLTLTSIFIPLSTGGQVIIYEESGENLIGKILNDNRVDTIKLTPTHLKLMVETQELFSEDCKVSRLILGGELLETSVAQDIYQRSNGRIEIYNEYGPTEATVGCMSYKFNPEDKTFSVPIGNPIQNTRIYLLNDNLTPVPVGGIGELYISGSGLARGYANDPSLTSKKFPADVFVGGGQRMYRTGDLARWVDEAKIEYLGRADDQVKIRGFRIEPLEISCRLSMLEQVRDSVVVACGEIGDKYLVAYYVAAEELPVSYLKEHLSTYLPHYMMPAHYVRLDKMPLTANLKIDRKALPTPELTNEEAYVGPETQEEELLCDIWSKVLGVGKISILDNFFSLGGDSIRSIQICSRLRTAGYDVTVKDTFTYQTIKLLSRHLKALKKVSDQSTVTGLIPLTGIQSWFFENKIKSKQYYNQSVMLNFEQGISEEEVRTIFTELLRHHDALRMVYQRSGNKIDQYNHGLDYPLSCIVEDLTTEEAPESKQLLLCNGLQASIDLESGPLMKLALFKRKVGSQLLIVIHHLVIDGVSWRILFEDIETLYTQLKQGVPLKLPLKTDSFKLWAEQLQEYRNSKKYRNAITYWNSVLNKKQVKIRKSDLAELNIICDAQTTGFHVDEELTAKILGEVHKTFSTQINDILLAGFLMSINEHYGPGALKIDLESHGREQLMEGIEIGRTIGWFTSIYPMLLEHSGEGLSGLIKSVKESLRQVPNNGIDYLIGKYQPGDEADIVSEDNAVIIYNYLGQFDSDTEGKTFSIAKESTGNTSGVSEERNYEFELLGMVSSGCLRMSLTYSTRQYEQRDIEALMVTYKESLKKLVEYCLSYGKQELTPSDLTYKGLSNSQLEELQKKLIKL